jgi:hypothetical protein
MIPMTGLIGAASSAIGGIGQSRAYNRGLAQYKNFANQGIDQLKSGMQTATQAYDPYAQSGQAGLTGELAAVQGRQQAQLPQLQQTTAESARAWMDPSANYMQDQARKAAQASGLATGATGGGMQKAIADNAAKMGLTAWNNAAAQNLAANQANFGQQQQNYANTTDYQQQQIGNYGNIANRGLQSQNALQGLLGNYNTGINQNYLNMGQAALGTAQNQGDIWRNTAGNLGKQLGSIDWSSFLL